MKKDECDKALADFEMAIKLAPKNAEAYNLRAMAYDAMGDDAKAKEDRKHAKELRSKPE